MTGLHKRFSDGRKTDCNMAAEDDHCEKNDNHSVIAHPIWMMNTLLDIDCLAQYEPSI